MTIGQRIAQLRREKNLSQEALGEALGVSRQAISKWESDGALPEVEKLVALSKLFGVTVGSLLGVEDAQTGNPDELPLDEEKLEQYLTQRNRKKAAAKKWHFITALAVILCLGLALWGFVSLTLRVSALENRVSALTEQLSGVQAQLSGVSGSISQQVEDALAQQNSVSAGWDLQLDGMDFEASTATITLTTVPVQAVSDVSELCFYALLSDGTTVQAAQADWDGSRYQGSVIVPIEDGIQYYLTVSGETQLLEGYELSELAANSEIDCTLNFLGSTSGSRLSGSIDTQAWMPSTVLLDWQPNRLTGLELWLVVSAADGTERSRTPLEVELDNEEWATAADALSNGALSAHAAFDPIDGGALEVGDLIWGTARYDFGETRSVEAQTDFAWCWNGSGFDVLNYDESSGTYQAE